ncbi:Penicillin-binding protein 1F [Corynebacterium ciconiae DSM 44920]|uniref:transglycosylase domain-containing protein n=1 Tax=Corynebacterium ciconiae TaxID=227319 RepID=UPI00037A99D0|nr:transglycosylase domain-containing protein [Corynebacterium ciconiae]WKD62206.1 Penicillin-binding protein 1F [Corynebacterium ciconiae DSM 44920]
MSSIESLGKVLIATVAAGVLSAVALTPLAGLSGAAVARAHESMASDIENLTDGTAPGVTEIQDRHGAPMAWLYTQRRFEVPPDRISDAMKQAIVSIEDRRFYEHDGVDWQGAGRAMVKNMLAGSVLEGASTLDQQYIKNYALLVEADNDEEQAEAIETSYTRKFREIRAAAELEKRLNKDEILGRYLNLVPFGNGAYGVEAAARTYFGVSAAELTVPQAATLAGIVQSSSMLDPYNNIEGVTSRRNLVLNAMAEMNYISREDADAFAMEPLGVLDEPQGLPNGCITTGDRGFFCDYVIRYLADKGISEEDLRTNAYTIRTSLDPEVQTAAKNAVTTYTDPHAPGVAEVMNVIKPGKYSREIQAMVSSRTYGLNGEAGETILPQASTMVGNGAGSVFKVFTAAAAIEQGMGIDTQLSVPKRYEAYGLGEGGAEGCPPGAYCVENAGTYPPKMSLKGALAKSPNTPFVELIEKVGVGSVVDLSVKMGLRSYSAPGSFDGESSIAEYMKNSNLGSYTLGPTAVNPLELSNVGATIASDGIWCEPNPVMEMTDREGKEVELDRPECERALSSGVAQALSDALSDDFHTGTASESAKSMGWSGSAAGKTGTTESNQSSSFLGFNSGFAAAPYIYNDGTSTSPLCTSPVRQCGRGDLYGGKEPARTWISAAQQVPAASNGNLEAADGRFRQGTAKDRIPKVVGMQEKDAVRTIEEAGFRAQVQFVTGNGTPRGQVKEIKHDAVVHEGSTVTLNVSDGSAPPPPPPPPAPRPRSEPLPPLPNTDEIADAINDILRNL